MDGQESRLAGIRESGPDSSDIENLKALVAAGQYGEAETRARRMVREWPGHEIGWQALAIVLGTGRRYAEALPVLQKMLELWPSDKETYQNIINVLSKLGRLTEAEEICRRALELDPDSHEMHNSLGNIMCSLGCLPEAEASYRRAFAIVPSYAEAYSNLGSTLHSLGRYPEAEATCRRALELKPDLHHAHNNLGNTLQVLGRLKEAVRSCRRAVELKPDFHHGFYKLGNALLHLGDLSEAETNFRRALEIEPDFSEVHNSLLFCLSHNERVDAQTLFSEHCAFGQQFEAPLRASWPRHANARDPERKLQVGFVSGDFRDHAVAYFIELVLAQLSGRPRLSLHAYSNFTVEDNVTQRLQGYFSHWHRVAGLTDAALAESIQADGIDILIDLSGHTGLNRLLTFARKPAPVQLSWIGYPGVDPLSWTLFNVGIEGGSRCPVVEQHTRRSSGRRWSSWCARAVARRSWRRSSSPRPRRFETGSPDPEISAASARRC